MQLPKSYNPGDTLTVKDAGLSILMTPYWFQYRLGGSSFRCSSKIKVTALNPDGTYLLSLMSTAPEDGRVRIPTNVTSTVSLHQIHLAVAYSTVTLPIVLPDRVASERESGNPQGRPRTQLTREERELVGQIRKLWREGTKQIELVEQFPTMSASKIYQMLHHEGKWRD